MSGRFARSVARPRVVVVGDALLDRDVEGQVGRLASDAPVPVLDGLSERERPGGAGLAAALAAAAGHPVTLICALGDDPAKERLAALLAEAGVEVCDLGLDGATPVKVRVCSGARTLVRLDHSGLPAGHGAMTEAARAALRDAGAVLVSDYGYGLVAEPSVREALAGLPGEVPMVWDPHPRGPAPVPGVLLVTPNEAEAVRLAGDEGRPSAGLARAEACGRVLARRWQSVDVCVTLGDRGALVVGGAGPPLAVPAPAVAAGDPCGAGDCFAATATTRLAAGALPSEAVRAAVVAASGFVARGGAGAWARDRAAGAAAAGSGGPPGAAAGPADGGDARSLAARVRALGGTVVATGGCFDLLHAGHVRALEAARALGDCLVVCLNSDDSVRRLKGPDRPLVEQEDRAALLAALACVDAVAIFEQDDPREVLRELRPHVWAKGGDYAVAELPEAEVLAEWGGQAVIVPYVAGKSTTRLIEEAVSRAR